MRYSSIRNSRRGDTSTRTIDWTLPVVCKAQDVCIFPSCLSEMTEHGGKRNGKKSGKTYCIDTRPNTLHALPRQHPLLFLEEDPMMMVLARESSMVDVKEARRW
mmetsp:Transcript_29744/g.60393  ORF Transcript_29744/g.60393 Transcript_29744/m.60393 type:complete len:104 (+) Transcript_29744:3210-3521(+)